MANAAMPSMMPTMIASHGKPEIAGNTIGVVVETGVEVELLVVVGVLTTVNVDTEVLTMVVMRGLVVTNSAAVLEVDVPAWEDVDALTWEEADVLVAALPVIEDDSMEVELAIEVVELVP